MKGRETILGQQVRGVNIDSLVQCCLYLSRLDNSPHCKTKQNKTKKLSTGKEKGEFLTALTSLIPTVRPLKIINQNERVNGGKERRVITPRCKRKLKAEHQVQIFDTPQ